MGQEIGTSGFAEADFTAFRARLADETADIAHRLAGGRLSHAGPIAGFELEAWLVDPDYYPAPYNQSFLARLDDPLVVPELSRFNIELNGLPRGLAGDGLFLLEQDLDATLRRCIAAAHDEVATVIAIGTLPTLRESDLSLDNMTPSNRYAALNRELQRLRGGAPVLVDIDCAEPGGRHLKTSHSDVMLEAAATSFQLHYQVPVERISATLNASMVLSAPLVALAANSPFLFGHALWHETRIAIFEQAFEHGVPGAATLPRVTFGSGYAGPDPTGLFAENLARYPVVLPVCDSSAHLPHLRLHNGTVWRWNRLLVGFDEDDTPHLRIEQRVMPAGPTVLDMMANAAFYYGAVHMLATRPQRVENVLGFQAARSNFYTAARLSMGAEIAWLDGSMHPVRDVLRELVPLAREGLHRQGVNATLVDRYMDLVELRVASGRNGAAWQLAHFARHRDLFRLTADYAEHQRSAMPVHEWPD